MNDNLKKIIKVVSWYNELPKDYSNIEELLYVRKQLCTNLFAVAIELTKTRQEWKKHAYEVERIKRQSMQSYLEEGVPVSKAEAYAKAEALEALEQETMIESAYMTLKILVDNAVEVNTTMMQHVSNLKEERKNVNF